MVRKDLQHYVSRSYLRNFSPDMEKYLEIRESVDKKRRKKFKDKMKIHYYNLVSKTYDYRRIYSLARVNHYLLPIVDQIVRRTENKLSLLREIINCRSEDILYQGNNQQTIWEIANCLRAMSFTFRRFAEDYSSSYEGSLVEQDGTKFASLIHTDAAAELYQTGLVTRDPAIIFPLLMKSYIFHVPSDGTDDTFEKIFHDEGLMDDLLADLADGKIAAVERTTVIPETVYPIMIENQTNLEFITGDECVPKTAFIPTDMATRVYYHFFPLSPEIALILLFDKEDESYFHRKISSIEQIHRWNRLVFDCSMNYLFGKTSNSLRYTINEPERKVPI